LARDGTPGWPAACHAAHWHLAGWRGDTIFGENAPSAGPPPYAFFELIPTTVFGLPGLAGTEEAGTAGSLSPTRWRF
jgi:hypothetical protein